jgi:hypothetical protein
LKINDLVAREGVERFSAPWNQQVADSTMDTKDGKDTSCVRFVCGFSLQHGLSLAKTSNVPFSREKSAVTRARIKSQDNNGATKAASRGGEEQCARRMIRQGKNSAAQLIRQRARNDDEDLRHEATQLPSFDPSIAVAFPVSVFEVRSGCGRGGSNRRNQRAAASSAIR